MTAKSLALLAVLATSSVAGAQSWSRSYDAGLDFARAGKWAQAREAFQQAAAGRPDDRSAPTALPGPTTERKLWRNGAPYSPNFLAAYSLYRQGLATVDPVESTRLMRSAAVELETLIAKDQTSAEAFFYLDVIYTRLDDQTKRQALNDRYAKLGRKADFKVDTEVVAPEEIAALQARGAGGNTTSPALPGLPNTPPILGPGPNGKNAPAVAANVVPLKEKYALVVGQSNSRVSGGMLSYAATDAERVRAALVDFAGYPADNVVMVQNASAATVRSAANDLAGRMGDNSIVCVYYAGAGVNVNGKDYLAGVDTEQAGDIGTMVAKTDLFQPFVQRGARIFAFFETNRPMDADGAYFGRESITVGSVSQVQSTIAGENTTLTYRDNKPIGLFTNAFVSSLANLRSNHLPIFEFTWQVVSFMRRGDSGTTGGGGRQVCTLPKLTNLAADSKF